LNNKHRLLRFMVSFLPLLFLGLAGCSSQVRASQTAPATVISGDNKSYSVTAANGLRLTLSLDSTTYKSGDTVIAFIDEWNTKTNANNISPASGPGFPFSSMTIEPNGTGVFHDTFPIGISILQGNYDLANVKSGGQLDLRNPANATLGLPVPVIKSYDFQPSSDIANFQPDSAFVSAAFFRVTGTISSAGFWYVDWGLGETHYQDFTPGIYTVVGGDMWGSLAILHFTVN
jgi:hypothetical protein